MGSYDERYLFPGFFYGDIVKCDIAVAGEESELYFILSGIKIYGFVYGSFAVGKADLLKEALRSNLPLSLASNE